MYLCIALCSRAAYLSGCTNQLSLIGAPCTIAFNHSMAPRPLPPHDWLPHPHLRDPTRYPPFWVPLALLHAAMVDVEPASGRPRGFAIVTRQRRPPPLGALAACCRDDGTHADCGTTCTTPHA